MSARYRIEVCPECGRQRRPYEPEICQHFGPERYPRMEERAVLTVEQIIAAYAPVDPPIEIRRLYEEPR